MRSFNPQFDVLHRRTRGVVVGVVLLGLTLVSVSNAHAWGALGHRHIASGAIPDLPQPLRSFFQINETAIRNAAGTEPPGRHYIDIDVYPEFAAGTFPHDINDLIAIYGYPYVESNGMGPWTYENYVTTLTSLMTTAKTKQDWLNLIPTIGAQAHYIEDMHNPLHLTYNYDGQYSGNNGVHSRYESQMISSFVGQLTFTAVPAEHETSVIDDVFDGIYTHHPFVDDIMAADTAAIAASGGSFNTTYFNSLWAQTGAFTKVLFQEASEAVADGWYTAWLNAGSPIPNLGLSGDYNGDNVINAVDYTLWRNAMSNPAIAILNDPTPAAVNEGDYQYWKTHYGDSIGVGGGGASSAPEPSTIALAIFAAMLFSATCVRRDRTFSRRP